MTYQRQPAVLRLVYLKTVLAALLFCPSTLAVTPISGWSYGIATNYGGPADGMSPYEPSFGTQDVSAPFFIDEADACGPINRLCGM